MTIVRPTRQGKLLALAAASFLLGSRASALEIDLNTVYEVAPAPTENQMATLSDTTQPVVSGTAPHTPVSDPTSTTINDSEAVILDEPVFQPYEPEDDSDMVVAVTEPYYPYRYQANIFIFGDDRVPEGFSNAVESFNDDKIVYDANDHSVGILPQYIHEREVAAGTVTSYLGYDDIATLWEGRSLGSITLSGETVIIDGYVYSVSGTLNTSTLYVDEDGVEADFYPLEDGQCNLEGIAIEFSLPVETFEVSSGSLTISMHKKGTSPAPISTATVKFSHFPASYTARGTFLLDYGDGAANGLVYEDHLVAGRCAVEPDASITVTSGSIAPSTVEFILQQILCTSGSSTFAEAIDEDTRDMMLDTQDGFGQYFTDNILRWNPLTSGTGVVSYSTLRYHEVEGVDIAELVMSVGSFTPPPTDALYLTEDEVKGTSANLSNADARLENLLETLIPAMLTGTGGEDGTTEAAGDCDYEAGDDGITLTCNCEEESGLSDCEVSMTIGYPSYVWTYEDGSGTERTFEVDYDWRSGTGCDAPIREVRANNLAFHVVLSDIHFQGSAWGLPFNIEGSGGFTVQGLSLALDFDSLAQRGDPDDYDCMNRLSYCLNTVDMDDTDGLTLCISDSDGSEGGPSGAACPLDFYTALLAFSTAETESDLADAVDQFDDAIEPSTLLYRRSYLDLDDAELSMTISLSESNLFITEDDLETLAYELADMIDARVEENLVEMASTDDLLGPEGVILERIYGYRMARDLVDAAGMPWSSSFQVDVADDGSQAVWSLVHRARIH